MSLNPEQFSKFFKVAPGNPLNLPDYVPPAPGESPIPEGTMRASHFVRFSDRLDSIHKQGLLRSHARPESEAPVVFMSAGAHQWGEHDDADFPPTVEAWVRPDQIDVNRPSTHSEALTIEDDMRRMERRRDTITLTGDLPPEQILTIHEPWHHAYRLLSNSNVTRRDDVLAGHYDFMLDQYPNTYGRAIKKIKSEGPYSTLPT